MTCREAIMKEDPDRIDPEWCGGVEGCPNSDYTELAPRPEYCPLNNFGVPTNDICTKCWDREVPEEKNEEITLKTHKNPFAYLKQHTPAIKDSGDRTEFESGAVRDMRSGKGRCDLMPLRVAAKVVDGDSIIDDIGLFLDTGDTQHLYFALRTAARMFNGLADMLLEVAKHFEEGAEKYGENNWQKGIPVHCYIDSAVRHYLKWLRGDTDEPHDRAFVWNLLCCIWEVDYHDYTKPNEDEAEAGCDRCRNATHTDETFHVINPSGIGHNVVFNFCPVCGRKIPKKEIENE